MNKKVPHLSIVIPAYNEAGNIEEVIEQSAKEAKKITNSFEIIVCDDGSSDNTSEIVKTYQKKIPQLKLIVNKSNQGLGRTLLSLFKESRGEFIQTLPGDCQMRARELGKFYKAIQNSDLVIGYRINRKDPFYRLVASKIYNLCAQILFRVKTHDIGTIKMIRRSALAKINLQTKTNFIEAELVIKAYQLGLKVVEVPINYYPREYGKATGAEIKTVARIFIELLKYFLFGKI